VGFPDEDGRSRITYDLVVDRFHTPQATWPQHVRIGQQGFQLIP